MEKIPHNASDKKLVQLSKENLDNFEFLVIRYQKKLFGYIRKVFFFSNEDIEDILQEVFIKVYKNLNDFDQSLKFSTWIYQITRNCLIDELRKKHNRPQKAFLEERELLKIFRSSTNIEKEVVIKEKMATLKKIIFELPFKYKEVIILKFLEEKSYQEIIDIVKKPKGTVAALINRGRKKIKEEAEKQGLFLN